MLIQYILKVTTEKVSELNDAFDIAATDTKYGWELSLDGDDTTFADAVSCFAGLLERRWSSLSRFGITNEDISIWILYEYEQQCNFEFSPAELRKIADLGVPLCISCWELGSEITLG